MSSPTSRGSVIDPASFQVVEVEAVYPVRFEELPAPDSEIAAYLASKDPLFGPKLPGTAPVLQRYAAWVQQFLGSRGVEEKIAGRVAAAGPDELVVLFRPARQSPVVATVAFTGNQAVETRPLMEAINGVAIGTAYKEERFRQLLDASIRPLYEARGHLRVTFPKVSARPAQDVKGLHVDVEISEGGVFELASVRVEGPEGFSTQELVKAAAIKTGDTANFDEVNEGAVRVRKFMQRNGYMRARTSVRRDIDDAKKTVAAVIAVEEGPRFVFGNLEIRGLDLHGEAAIRKLWAPQPGKPFNVEYPEFFLNRVRDEGYFDNLNNTRAETRIDEERRAVDVTLHFNEAKKAPPLQ